MLEPGCCGFAGAGLLDSGLPGSALLDSGLLGVGLLGDEPLGDGELAGAGFSDEVSGPPGDGGGWQFGPLHGGGCSGAALAGPTWAVNADMLRDAAIAAAPARCFLFILFFP